MATVGAYRMEFEVDNNHLPFVELALDAGEALYDQVEDLGYRPTSAVRYALVAIVDVEIRRDDPDDARPWESRRAYAADMFDVVAA